MVHPIRVLLVEDNPDDVLLLGEAIVEVAQQAFELAHVETLHEGLACLAEGDLEVVLLDLTLPDSAGITTLTTLRQAYPDIPVVVLTGLEDEALALRAVEQGAQDFLVKGRVDGHVLVRALRYAIQRHRAEENARLYADARAAAMIRDEVLGIVAHDLRNPLNVILTMISSLVSDAEIPEERRQKRLQTALRSADRMNRLIQDLLDVSRLELDGLAIDREVLPLGPLVHESCEAIRPLAGVKSLAVTVELPAPDPTLHVDRHRVLQLFSNLLGNAIKFTPEHGTIRVRAERDGDLARIEVCDTGCGIAPDHLPLLFDGNWRERRARGGGSGFGLQIVKGIVEAHGGTLQLASTLNRGTCVTFTLPLADGLRSPTSPSD